MEIYKRIAMIQDEEGKMEIEDELIDRFGDIPEPVVNLMRIAQLRGITRKLGISRLYLRPDGVHMRLDKNFVPDMGQFYTAACDTDKRLFFTRSTPTELVLAQRNLSDISALETAIYVTARLHDQIEHLKKQAE